MEGKTFIFVILSGLCFLPACFCRIYVVVEVGKNWSDAQSYCRSKYTDLATAENKEESDQLVAAAKQFYNRQLWMGLYDDIHSWRCSLQKEGYYGEGEAEFRMWNSGEPNNFGGYEDCVQMLADGTWNDWSCKSTFQFVCYNETVTSSSFIFVNDLKTWSEAQSYCREHYTDLASVRNRTEIAQINKLAQNQIIWIGLYRDSWKWSDGSPTSWMVPFIPPGNINSPCVYLNAGQWVSYQCDATFYFICEIDVSATQQLMRVKITDKGSSVNLEDAAEAMLQQFRQTLSDNMKLTWRKQPDGKIFHLEEKEKKENQEISCNLN
ncbi:macrophage mannose receptor 1-like [Micropterus salmoides]|uniref:macrophage mannose receptor 1-like n=1 Tax=Micropterus salmoides TaxID=27706 RepID=UPI0018ED11C1|nr:macrophage mannose receptor 1-like [Micropterus salmoides]